MKIRSQLFEQLRPTSVLLICQTMCRWAELTTGAERLQGHVICCSGWLACSSDGVVSRDRLRGDNNFL